MANRAALALGQLLLALDRTMVTLVEAPRGLDMPVGSVALVDADDVRLGLGRRPRVLRTCSSCSGCPTPRPCAGSHQIEVHRARCPPPSSSSSPRPRRSKRAVALGIAVVAVEPRARWELLYKLVNHAFEHHGDRGDPALATPAPTCSGWPSPSPTAPTGMISIEDEQSHVLAYSASSEEADELRRLTILGRAGPTEHLEWIGQWGIFDALRAGGEVVRVAERPGTRASPPSRRGIHLPATDARRPPGVRRHDLAAAGVRAAGRRRGGRAAGRRRAGGSHHVAAGGRAVDPHRPRAGTCSAWAGTHPTSARPQVELGIAADGRAALVGFRGDGAVGACRRDRVERERFSRRCAGGVYRRTRVRAAAEDRCAVIGDLLGAGRGGALHRELGLTMRAVIAAPLAGLAGSAAARAEVDRVFDSADRHPGAIDQVTSLDEARTTVLLDEIIAHVAGRQRLVDPRVRELREHDPMLADTLAAYLDGFGDIAAVAQRLHVHPNTVRYRMRRIEKLLSTSLDDPDDRLVLALGLRATERR